MKQSKLYNAAGAGECLGKHLGLAAEAAVGEDADTLCACRSSSAVFLCLLGGLAVFSLLLCGFPNYACWGKKEFHMERFIS